MTAAANRLKDLAGTVATGLVRGLFRFAVDCGVDEVELSKVSGVSLAELEDADARSPLATYAEVTWVAKRLGADAALSLRFGERVPMAELSALAFAAPAPAVQTDTLALLNRFGRLVADVGPNGRERFQLQRRDGGLWLCDLRPNPNVFPDLTESGFARMAANARRRGVERAVQAIEVTHPDPGYAWEYARVFDAPVRFDGRVNAMRVDERMLATPSQQHPNYADEVLAAHAQTLLRRLEQSSGVRALVEAELSSSTPLAPLSMEAVAARLGLSTRTLARRLEEEGASFAKVLDGVRLQRALKHMVEERRGIAEVAHLTGFSDRSAFARAFRRWTGKPPGAPPPS